MYMSIESAIEISVIEILLISIIAFIGSFIHEYMYFIGKGKKITITVWINVFITVIVDIIISISINPFIIALNPRLILLPPLLIGLVGNELVMRLTTLHGSTSIIEYILGFFKISSIKDNSTLKSEFSIIDKYKDIKTEVDIMLIEYDLEKDYAKLCQMRKYILNDIANLRNLCDSNPTCYEGTEPILKKLKQFENTINILYNNETKKLDSKKKK